MTSSPLVPVETLVKEANLFFGISFLLLDGGEAAGQDRASSSQCELPGLQKDGFASLCQKAANILDIDGEWVSRNNAYFDSSKCAPEPRSVTVAGAPGGNELVSGLAREAHRVPMLRTSGNH